MCYPNDTYYMYWDMWISFILLISCIITPINFAFQDELENVEWYVIFNYAIDLFFLAELIVNFNTAFEDEDKEIVDSRKEIAKRYLSGWFVIDIVSILPLDIILLAFVEGSGSDAQVNRMIKMGKFSKLYKLIKITRLFRLLKLMKNRGKVVKIIGNSMQLS